MFYTLDKTPNANERILPFVNISKITLSVGSELAEPSTEFLSAVDDLQPPQRTDTSFRPLKIVANLSCRDLYCTANVLDNSIFLNEDLSKNLKIYVQETVNGFSKVEVFGIEKGFTKKQFIEQNASYMIEYVSQIPFLNPESLTIEAWIELDIRNVSDQQLQNLSFNSSNTLYSGMRNKINVIEGSAVTKNIEYSYSTSMNNNHMHGIDSIDSDGNGYTNVHRHAGAESGGHRHQIINGIVQVAGQRPHVHNIKPLTSIIDKRTKDLLTSIPITVTVPKDFKTKQQNKNFFQAKTNNFSDVENSFSKIWFSRDESLQNRIAFGINFKNLMKSNAIMNGLLVKDSNYERFLKFAPPTVYSMEIFRKRIKGNSESNESYKSQENSQFINPVFGNTNKTLVNKFEDGNAEFPVCFVYNQRINKKFSPVFYNEQVPFPTLAGNSFSELNLFKTNEYKFFSVLDRTMAGNNNGFYQYGVKLKIYDSSNLIFTSHLSTMKTIRRTLENYLNEALSNNFSGKSPFQNDGASKTDSYGNKKRDKKPPTATLTVPASKDYDNLYSSGELYFGNEQKNELNLGYNNNQLVKGEMAIKNFNGKTNSFTSNFAQNNSFTPNNKSQSIEGPLQDAIMTYLEILSFYTDKEIRIKEEMQRLTNFLSPFSGSPDTIGDVISMFSELEKKINSLSSIYKQSMEKNSSTAALSKQPKGHVGAGTRNKSPIFEVEYMFKEVYNSNIPRGVGIDFMSLGPTSTQGLKTISKKKFYEIMDFENRKLFKGENSNLSIEGFTDGDTSETTKYSFVTPNSIKINPEVVLSKNNRYAQTGDKQTYQDIATITAISNLGKETKTKTSALIDFSTDKIESDKIKNTFINEQKPITQKDKTALDDGKTLDNQIKVSNKISEFFATNMGIRVVDGSTKNTNKDDKPLETSSATEEDKTKSYVLNDLGNGKTSEANRAATKVLNTLLKANDKKDNFKVEDYSLSSGNSKIRNRAEKFQSSKNSVSTELKKAPNQVKALFKTNELASQPDSTFVLTDSVDEMLKQGIDGENRDAFRYRFQTIQKIEVLVGFEKKVLKDNNQNKNVSSQIAMPNWTTLTKEIIEDIKEQSLLCRLTPYESKLFNIKRDKKYDLPIYDQYFLISKE